MREANNKFKVFCIVGTRPEFIKMYPVYKLLWERASENLSGRELEVKWISSAQHQDLLQDLEDFFKVKPDYSFAHFDQASKSLGDLAAEIIVEATKLFVKDRPDLIFIQGDTMTAQQCALAAFYEKIPIAHIEAGIRTNNIDAPFPEELARRIISQVATLNFAPGQRSLTTLEAEKILFKKQSYNFFTGNTVVDTLDFASNKIKDLSFDWSHYALVKEAFTGTEINLAEYLRESKFDKMILVTAHRRENQIDAINNLTEAIYRIAERFKDSDEIEFLICLHKNPLVRIPFQRLFERAELAGLKNIKIVEALNYPLFIGVMLSSYFIVTDSGGVQEEAPYLDKPVLVFRNETERTEGIDLGFSKLIGTEEHLVHGAILEMILDQDICVSMIKSDLQPYGDGLAATRIVDISMLYLKQFDVAAD